MMLGQNQEYISITLKFNNDELDIYLLPTIRIVDLFERLDCLSFIESDFILHIGPNRMRIGCFAKLSDYPLNQWSVLEIINGDESVNSITAIRR